MEYYAAICEQRMLPATPVLQGSSHWQLQLTLQWNATPRTIQDGEKQEEFCALDTGPR